MAKCSPTPRRRVCARCGDAAGVRHRCQRYNPARAALALDTLLPASAGWDDVHAHLHGTPAEVAHAAAHLPRGRRDRIWADLAGDRQQAHEGEAA
jgi:hypothetical protein